MSFNQILANRLTNGNFPENTSSVVLSLVPELDYVDDYVYIFRKEYEDTATHIYKLLRVYLIKCSTYYFDNRTIITEIQRCIKDAWKEYNTEGNQIYIERYNWGKTSDIAMIEFEELDIIYNKIVNTESLKTGDISSYNMYYKESTKKYFGTVMFSLDGNLVPVEMEYTKKPSEAKYKKDATEKFCKDYNVIIYED